MIVGSILVLVAGETRADRFFDGNKLYDALCTSSDYIEQNPSLSGSISPAALPAGLLPMVLELRQPSKSTLGRLSDSYKRELRLLSQMARPWSQCSRFF
jgi:hypothetical protein